MKNTNLMAIMLRFRGSLYKTALRIKESVSRSLPMIAQMRRVVSAHSRAQKMREFFAMCPEGSTVLEVGVSGARMDET